MSLFTFLKDLTVLATMALVIAVVIGWISLVTPMDADSGPAPLTAWLEGGRV